MVRAGRSGTRGGECVVVVAGGLSSLSGGRGRAVPGEDVAEFRGPGDELRVLGEALAE
jgi:hypothetical protein